MTCIVGVVKDGIVYLGGDSAGTNGYTTRGVKMPKVFRAGEFVIGYTGSFRYGQILAYHLTMPPQRDDMPDEVFMVTQFVESARTAFKDFGYARIDSNEESADGDFLVGYRGRLYLVQSDLSIIEHAETFDAVGSGAHVALGVLAALEDLSPKKRIKRALTIASQIASGVRPPFTIVNTKRNG